MLLKSADLYYSQEEMDLIKSGISKKLSYNDIAEIIYETLGIQRTRNGIRKHVARHRKFYSNNVNSYVSDKTMTNKNVVDNETLSADYQLDKDIALIKLQKDKKSTDEKYKLLLNRLNRIEKERDSLLSLSKNLDTFEILPSKSEPSEATAFLIASDWHVAERVDSNKVSGLNEYNLDIAKDRAEQFFKNGLRLINIQQKDVHIDTVVLGLLGDFISGNIHPELMENNLLLPIEEAIFAQNLIASGIEYLLKDKSLKKIIVPCTTSNHGRITPDRRISTEAGNNLEHFIFHQLSNHFRDNARVEFLIADGYHIYMSVYDFGIRLHHGHAISYGGGIGGITIPVNKAISQWNKLRKVDLDIFGHFHTFFDGGNFISNGSNIGYNPYALSIKANFDQPKQVFFLLDKKRGKTIVAPILYDV